MEFKVGDTVKIQGNIADWKGCVVTIIDIRQEGCYLLGKGDDRMWIWTDKIFEPVKFTKKDLRPKDVITRRNETVAIVDEDGYIPGYGSDNNVLTDTLENTGCMGSEYDIMKVERPISYDVVYMREEDNDKKTNEELHRELWRWLAKHPDKKSLEWFKETKAPSVYNHCFACQEAENAKCELCPLDKDIIGCYTDDGLFSKWNFSTDLKVKSALASVIAELPWRTKNEK